MPIILGDFKYGGIMNLKTLVSEFLEEHKFSIKERTYLTYLQIANHYLKGSIGECELSKLSSVELNNYIQNLRKSFEALATIKIIKTLLNQALNYAFSRKYINNTIKISVNLKSQNMHKISFLEDSEINKIEEYILNKKRYHLYGILITLYTGLRIGELLALKWDNIDFQNKVMNITATICDVAFDKKMYHIESSPKSESGLREIPLTNNVIKLLLDLRKNQENSIFVVSKKGKQLFVRAYQDSFARLLRRLKIKHYGFHSLRHTFATRCYRHGMDIKTLSELLGHSSPSVTLKIYVHTDLNIKRKALDLVTKKIRQSLPNK